MRLLPSMKPFERVYGVKIPAELGMHLTEMCEAMEHGELTALYLFGENSAWFEAVIDKAGRLLDGIACLTVKDIFITRTSV
jgi:predicted molibdopterin-dependent oxidoreductase YjgC